MAAKSNNLTDVFDWLCDVLESCKTEEQQESAKRLILLFINKLIHNAPVYTKNGYTNEALFMFSAVQLIEPMRISMKYPYVTIENIKWEVFGGLKHF